MQLHGMCHRANGGNTLQIRVAAPRPSGLFPRVVFDSGRWMFDIGQQRPHASSRFRGGSATFPDASIRIPWVSGFRAVDM